MPQIDTDHRTDAEKHYRVFVVFHDRFMSGWGKAGSGRSLYVLACLTTRDAEVVLDNGKRRSEMRRGRITSHLPRKRPGDHLSVAGPTEAPRWYEPGAWAKGNE